MPKEDFDKVTHLEGCFLFGGLQLNLYEKKTIILPGCWCKPI